MEWIKPDQQKEIEDQTQEQTGDTEMEQANYQMAIRSGAYNKEVNQAEEKATEIWTG